MWTSVREVWLPARVQRSARLPPTRRAITRPARRSRASAGVGARTKRGTRVAEHERMPQSTLRHPDDFTLRIVVTEPDDWRPNLADEEGAPTRPFKKALHALGLTAVPPQPLRPKPEPLSDGDHQRLLKRARACRRIAWARNLLRKFNFEDRS